MLTRRTSITVLRFMLNLIFCSSLSLQYSNQRKMNIHVPIQLSWEGASSYCRQHHTGLVTIKNRQESEALEHHCTAPSQCWFGLHRTLSRWEWEDGGGTNFTQWNTNTMYFAPCTHYCAALGGELWFHSPCNTEKEFLCYDENMILVKERKTWERALEHCRSLDPDTALDNTYTYQLMHVTVEEADYVKRALLFAQTNQVWLGLRFLAGRWLWLNGSPVQELLPTCPPPDRYCGTLSNGSNYLQPHDCYEENNFFCVKLQLY